MSSEMEWTSADIWKQLETEDLHRRLSARLSILGAALTNRDGDPDALAQSAGLLLSEAQDIHGTIQERGRA